MRRLGCKSGIKYK